MVAEVRRRMGDDSCSRSGTSRSPRSTPSRIAAALAAEVAGLHGQFWPMHDRLFAGDEPQLRQADLRRYAEEIGVPPHKVVWPATQFVEDRVEADFNSGVRSGVRGTPTFFVDGELYRGDTTVDGPARAAPGRRRPGPMTGLRIATYNLLHGLDVRSRQVDLDAAAEAIDKLDADVVAVQEVDRGLSRSGEVRPGRGARRPAGPDGRVRSRRCSATRRCGGSAGPAPIPTRAARRTGSAC